jgi:hypothetical protein
MSESVQNDWRQKFEDNKGWKNRTKKKSAGIALEQLSNNIYNVQQDIEHKKIEDKELKKILKDRFDGFAKELERIADLDGKSAKIAITQLQQKMPAKHAEYVAVFQKYEADIKEAVSPNKKYPVREIQENEAVEVFQGQLRGVVNGISLPIASDINNPIKISPSESARGLKTALKGYATAREEPQSVEGKMLELQTPKVFAEQLVAMSNTLAGFGARLEHLTIGEALAINRYTGEDYTKINQLSRDVYEPDATLNEADQKKEKNRLIVIMQLMPPLISVERCTEKKNRETGSGLLERLEIASFAFE